MGAQPLGIGTELGSQGPTPAPRSPLDGLPPAPGVRAAPGAPPGFVPRVVSVTRYDASGRRIDGPESSPAPVGAQVPDPAGAAGLPTSAPDPDAPVPAVAAGPFPLLDLALPDSGPQPLPMCGTPADVVSTGVLAMGGNESLTVPPIPMGITEMPTPGELPPPPNPDPLPDPSSPEGRVAVATPTGEPVVNPGDPDAVPAPPPAPGSPVPPTIPGDAGPGNPDTAPCTPPTPLPPEHPALPGDPDAVPAPTLPPPPDVPVLPPAIPETPTAPEAPAARPEAETPKFVPPEEPTAPGTAGHAPRRPSQPPDLPSPAPSPPPGEGPPDGAPPSGLGSPDAAPLPAAPGSPDGAAGAGSPEKPGDEFRFTPPRERRVNEHVKALKANPDDVSFPCWPRDMVRTAPASTAFEKGDRPVLVVFYDDGARASRLAAADLWPVVLALEARIEFVPVDLTPGAKRGLTDDERRLFRKYYLGYVPTTVVLSPDRTLRLLKSERVDPALVRAALEEAAGRASEPGGMR